MRGWRACPKGEGKGILTSLVAVLVSSLLKRDMASGQPLATATLGGVSNSSVMWMPKAEHAWSCLTKQPENDGTREMSSYYFSLESVAL